MKLKKMPPPHPGEFLREELLVPMKISMYRLAKDINVPAIRISEIIRGKRSITADTAMRLGRYFNISPEFWMNWQARYDIEKAKNQQEKFEKEVKPYKKLENISQKRIKSLSKSKIALHR